MRKINHFHLPAPKKLLLISVAVFSFLLSFFTFSRFSPDLKIKKANAQGAPQCHSNFTYVRYWESGWPLDGFGPINSGIRLSFFIDKNPDQTILNRYIYDGYSWVPVDPTEYDISYDRIELVRQYSETKDFCLSGGWVYREASGEIKTITCQKNVRIFNREILSFGTNRLTYPTKTSATQLIKGTYNYIGLIIQNTSVTDWYGDEKGYYALTPWYIRSADVSFEKSQKFPGIWATTLGYTDKIKKEYPSELPPQFTFNLTAATYNPGEGNNAYADYVFGNVVVYSRSTGYNACSVPNLTPTPTSTPTPTLTPPISNKCTTVSGYVRNSARVEKLGISGAKVRVWAMKGSSCTGSYSWCGSGDITTDNKGYFSVNCNAEMRCLRVIEVQNASGYKDSTVWPTVPTGSTIWSVNQVVWKNPPAGSCGTFTFYDVRN